MVPHAVLVLGQVDKQKINRQELQDEPFKEKAWLAEGAIKQEQIHVEVDSIGQRQGRVDAVIGGEAKLADDGGNLEVRKGDIETGCHLVHKAQGRVPKADHDNGHQEIQYPAPGGIRAFGACLQWKALVMIGVATGTQRPRVARIALGKQHVGARLWVPVSDVRGPAGTSFCPAGAFVVPAIYDRKGRHRPVARVRYRGQEATITTRRRLVGDGGGGGRASLTWGVDV